MFTRFRLGVAAAAIAVAACGIALTAQQKPERKPATIQIVIDRAVYQQPEVTARVGDRVEWINKDIVDHTATARNKAWDVKIPTGKTGRLTLEKAGTFEYYCTLHPNMVAKLIVRR